MNNFTLTNRYIPLLLVFCLSAAHAKAQCNAAFSYTVNVNQVTFTAAGSAAGKTNIWYANNTLLGFSTPLLVPFQQQGDYTIAHVLIDSLTGCIDSSFQTITLNYTATCQADFEFYLVSDSLLYPGNIRFHSTPIVTGTGITKYIWSIDNNIVDSSIDLIHYFAPGTSANVCLTIQTQSGCTSQKCKTAYTLEQCNYSPSVSYTLDTAVPGKVVLYPHPNFDRLQYKWHLGGYSHFSTGPDTFYFSYAGNYTVSLYVFDTVKSCFDSVQANIIIPPFPCDTARVTVNYHYAQGDSSTIFLSTQTNQPLVTYNWAIHSLYDSAINVNLYTPTSSYHFIDTGSYLVCVSGGTINGCYVNDCKVIYAGSRGANSGGLLASSPNPAVNKVNITVPLKKASKMTINIFDASGTTVYTMQTLGLPGNNLVTMPVLHLKQGQYYVEIVAGDERKKSVFQKF